MSRTNLKASDKWCIQHGQKSYSSNGVITINLNKSYNNTSYSIIGNCVIPDSSYSSHPMYFATRNITINSFEAGLGDDTTWNNGTFNWCTLGYVV